MPISGLYYGVYSFNLNGFFNSQGYSKIFPALPIWDNFQYEGLAYLGFGTLLLAVFVLACSIFAWIRKKQEQQNSLSEQAEEKGIRRKIPFIVFAASFLLISLSNKITWGSGVFEIPIPDIVYLGLAIFRCNGRLIWPLYYAIFLILTVKTIRILKAKPAVAGLVLALILGLNLYDFSDLIVQKHDRFNQAERMHYESPLTDPAWDEIGETYAHLMYYPQVAVIYSKAIGYDFQLYALDHGMSLNCIYFARDISTKVDQQTMAFMSDMTTDEAKNTAYIFLNRLPEQDYGLHYYRLNGILIGTPSPLHGTEEIKYQDLSAS